MSMESHQLAQLEDEGKTIEVGKMVQTSKGYLGYVLGIDDEGFVTVEVPFKDSTERMTFRIDELQF